MGEKAKEGQRDINADALPNFRTSTTERRSCHGAPKYNRDDGVKNGHDIVQDLRLTR